MSQEKIKGLKISAAKKREEALNKTEKAISNLIKNKQKITITSVARLAGVSTSYIYKYPELAYKIQTLRERQKYEREDSLLPISNNQHLVEKYINRVNNLEQEKARLTEEINTLNSSIESITSSDNSVEQLQANNVKLTIENQKLKQQLAKLEQEVYQLRGAILDRGYVEDRDRETEIQLKQRTIRKIN